MQLENLLATLTHLRKRCGAKPFRRLFTSCEQPFSCNDGKLQVSVPGKLHHQHIKRSTQLGNAGVWSCSARLILIDSKVW